MDHRNHANAPGNEGDRNATRYSRQRSFQTNGSLCSRWNWLEGGDEEGAFAVGFANFAGAGV